MAGELQAGASYVEVLPSLRGFTQRVKRAVTGQSVDVGVNPKVNPGDLAKAKAQVERAAEDVVKARQREADVAGTVRAAESKLDALRANAKTRADQIVAGEERVAKARRQAEAAALAVRKAEGAERSANRRVERIQADIDVDTSAATGKVRGFAALAKSLVTDIDGKVDLDTRPAIVKLVQLGGAMGALAMPAALVGALPFLASLGASAVQAAGGLALLPAAALAGGLAIGGLKIATSGVGDALKVAFDPEKVEQFQEALAKLSPEARASVLAIQGLSPQLDSLKRSTQDALFSGLAPLITTLGSTYLPIGEERFMRIAGAVNYAGTQFGTWLQGSQAIGLVKVAGDGAAAAFENIMFAAAPLGQVFLQVAAIGTPILAQLTAGAGGVATRLATWASSAEGIQTITGWIWGAIDVFRQLWALVVNVGTILGSVFGEANRSGESFLSMLVRVTGTMAQALKTPEGAAGLGTFFTTVRELVAGFVDKLVLLWPAVQAAAEALAALLGAAGPLTGVFLQLVVAALVPLLDLITLLAPVLGPIIAMIGIMRVVTAAWAAVQWLLNSALMANPITLVVLAIAALVGALIWAYQNVGWFRDLVNGAWQLIATAASWAWNTVLMPIFSAIGTAVTAVGNFFVWLWQSVIVPAWNAISAAISFVWNSILMPIFSAIGTALSYLGLAIGVLLVAPFVIAWNLISALVSWVWNSVLSPIWYGLIAPALAWLGQAFVNFYNNYIKPAWDWVVSAIQFAWAIMQMVWYSYILPALVYLGQSFVNFYNNYIKPAWDWVVGAIQYAWNIMQMIWYSYLLPALLYLGQSFVNFYNNFIKPAWDWVVSAIQAAWNFIRPVFDWLKAGVDAVGRTFQSVADWIGRAWDSIREAARRPVQWVVDVVYNNGIRPVWNGIAGLFGMAQLGPVTLAEGGVLGGYAPGRDTVPALLSRGEGVLVPEAVRGLGAGFVGWANSHFSGGRSSGGVGTPQGGRFSQGGIARFADGGILGGIGDMLSGAGDFFMNVFTDPAGAVKKLFSGVLGDGDRTPGTGGWTDALKALPGKAVEGVIARVKKWIEEMASYMGGAGGNWMPVIMQALAITGDSPDNAWRVAKQIQIESGGNPRAINLWDINAKRGTPSKGLIQTIDPTFQAYRHPGLPNDPYHPLANLVAGIRYAKSRYGSIAAIWPKTMGYDVGGVLPPGVSTAVNMTGANEHLAVFTTAQWSVLHELVSKLAPLPATLVGFVRDLRASTTTTGRQLGGVTTGLAAVSTGMTQLVGQLKAQTPSGPAAAPAPAVASPRQAAARELLNHIERGGSAFEDFSFRGNSDNLRAQNDALADAFYRRGGRFNRAEMITYLRGVTAGKFDRGGLAGGTGFLAKDVISPERVLSPRQTRDFGALVRALDAGRLAELPAGTGPLATALTDPSQATPAAMSRQRINGLAPAENGGPRVVINVQAAAEHDPERIADRVMHRLDFATRTQL